MLDDIAPSPRLWEQLTAAEHNSSGVTPQRHARGPSIERISCRSHGMTFCLCAATAVVL